MRSTVASLGDVCTKIGSGATPRGGDNSYKQSGIALVRSMNVHNGWFKQEGLAFIDESQAEKLKNVVLEENDVLLNITGASVARCCILNNDILPGRVNQHVCILRPKANTLNHQYLMRFLTSELTQSELLRIAGSGATREAITKAEIEKFQIPLPPLAEQKRIAAILDAADALRAKRRESLAQLDTLLQSTFLDMFGDPVTNPKGWEVVAVGDEIEFLTSGSRGWAKYYADSGDTFIRIQNLKNGKLDLSDIAYVNAPESAEAKRTRVVPSDVLLSITADLGRTAVVPEDIGKAHINQHLAILRFKVINPVFVSYQLATDGGQSQFDRLNREGVKAGLNFNDVKSIQLTKPPLDLQQRFATIVESVEQQKARLRDHLAELDILFSSLQQRAFTGDL